MNSLDLCLISRRGRPPPLSTMVDILCSVIGRIVWSHFSATLWAERAHWLRAVLTQASALQRKTLAPGAHPMRIEKKIRFRGNSEFASFHIKRTYKMYCKCTNQTKENDFFRKFLNKSKCYQLLRELELKFREKIKMFQTLDGEFYLQFLQIKQKNAIGRVLNFENILHYV